MKLMRVMLAGMTLTLVGCAEEGDELLLNGEAQDLQQTKISDLEYMRSLVKASPDPWVNIDLADDRQYRFVYNRLIEHGRSPESRPELFEQLAESREMALQGKTVPKAADSYAHLIADILQSPSNADRIDTDAYSTVRGGAPTSYIDVAMYSGTGATLGEQVQEKANNEGASMTIRTGGVLPAKTGDQGFVIVDSMAYNDSSGFLETSFSSIETHLKKPGKMMQPVDQSLPGVPLDGIVTVCLNRSWLYDAYDCEYRMDNTGGNILFPLKGEIQFDGTITKVVKAWMQLSMANNGGSCRPNLDFTSMVSIDPNLRDRVKWDIPQANFGRNCFSHQADVNINIGIQVDINLSNNTNMSGFGSISSQTTNSNATIPQIQFASSCLAAGTEVRMADGSLTAVESVGQESRVLSDVDGLALTVMDLSLGVEDVPMLRLEDNLGHSLLLTEGHPVVTVDGVKRADELQPGELVRTEDGVALLTSVRYEVYDGTVHNLKLGNAAERKLVDNNSTTFFANGFMVGDGRMQADIAWNNFGALDLSMHPYMKWAPKANQKSVRR